MTRSTALAAVSIAEDPAAHAARGQRIQNERRQTMTAALAGRTITTAKALANGDVALQLDTGTIVVLCAKHEDVDLREAKTFADAEGYANRTAPGDRYTALPTAGDRAADARLGN